MTFLQESLLPAIACRKLSDTEKSDLALIVWAQKAKLEARQIVTRPVRIDGLTKDIPIALVFLPHMKGSFWHGATFKDGKKIVIGLTVRGKDADKFWFSLFHELGHIVLGHVGKADGTTEAEEQAADAFAGDILIPSEPYTAFVSEGDFSKTAVFRFSDSIGIDAGIVLGRLQKDGYVAYNRLNELKTKYEITG